MASSLISRNVCSSSIRPSLQAAKFAVSSFKPVPCKRSVTVSASLSPNNGSKSSPISKLVELHNSIVEKIPGPVKSFLEQSFEMIQKPAVVFLLMVALTLANPDFAMAANSGGRVGGSNFSSRSYSAPSQSYSAPSYAAPSYSAPFFAPAPYYGWSPFSFFAPAPTVIVGGGGGFGGGIFSILFFGAILLVVANAVTGFLSNDSDDMYVSEKTSVLKLQIGLLGIARSLQRDLNRIAERADTSSSAGLHYILSETSLSLMRHPNYCVYGSSASIVERSVEEGEATFNRLSFDERSKLKQETLVNVGNVQKRSSFISSSDSLGSEFIVVTIVAATEGEVKLPNINSSADLREALSIIGSIPEDQLQAVEILWTPQEEGDTLTAQELLIDYPALRSL